MKTDRLSTLDEFGGRRFVIPAEVQGPFRKYRDRVYAVLLIVFLALPWIRINGLQAIWLDIPRRRFEVFGKLFLAHDAPLIFFLLAIGVMVLAFVTAVWGRIWCGWACPQTVFIDAVYRRIEIWVEGNYRERRQLLKSAMTWGKFRKTAIKWVLFLIVSSAIAHSFIAYFTGSRELIAMIASGAPGDNMTNFILVTFVTALLLFNFGWFREQFCSIMCPYGRFQSVLMDEDTVTIVYDEKRGDCVSCNRCVEVCPAAIDIRDGAQMECIGCTACIDACNEIMKKVNKPKDLISYQSLSGRGVRLFRPRTAAYLCILAIATIGLGIQFYLHKPFEVHILRGKGTPYQTLPNDMVLNHFRAHLLNQSQVDEQFSFALAEELTAAGVTLTQAAQVHTVPVGSDTEVHLFLKFPKSLLEGKGESRVTLQVHEARSAQSELKELTLVGPELAP